MVSFDMFGLIEIQASGLWVWPVTILISLMLALAVGVVIWACWGTVEMLRLAVTWLRQHHHPHV